MKKIRIEAGSCDTKILFFKDSFQNAQNSENLREKENKGFFGIFQRSKKKRQQVTNI